AGSLSIASRQSRTSTEHFYGQAEATKRRFQPPPFRRAVRRGRSVKGRERRGNRVDESRRPAEDSRRRREERRQDLLVHDSDRRSGGAAGERGVRERISVHSARILSRQLRAAGAKDVRRVPGEALRG